jgi:REP element-mobilizing transposase RayT
LIFKGRSGFVLGMARKVRIEYSGAIYHVMNRGDRREAIFEDAKDRTRFLETLEEACLKTDWQIHAYCLMGNHFHLVVETPRANLVAGMKWFLGTYTARFNRRHRRFGHLFSGRYKALLVDGSGNGYLRTVCDYVHLNPARANLLSRREGLTAYRWSSVHQYLLLARRRKKWLRVDRLLGEMGIGADNASGRAEFEEAMERRRREDLGEEWKKVRRGWIIGGGTFRRKALDLIEKSATKNHSGAEIGEAMEVKARRIVREGLKGLGWKEPELVRRGKSDKGKIGLAKKLRKETTMTLDWIADRLRMGSIHNIAKHCTDRK